MQQVVSSLFESLSSVLPVSLNTPHVHAPVQSNLSTTTIPDYALDYGTSNQPSTKNEPN